MSQKAATVTIEDVPSMASFYWTHITEHLVRLLRQVKFEIEGRWGTRDPSARWRLVKSTMKSMLLHKLSKARLLYRNCSRLPGLTSMPVSRCNLAGMLHFIFTCMHAQICLQMLSSPLTHGMHLRPPGFGYRVAYFWGCLPLHGRNKDGSEMGQQPLQATLALLSS